MSPTTVPGKAAANAQTFGDPQLHTDGDVMALTFAPDGSLWSVEEPGVVRRWNAASGQQLSWHSLSDLETVWCFSPDARFLASGGSELSLWDTAGGRLLAVLPQEDWVNALAFDSAARLVATGHDDGSVSIWDANTRKLAFELEAHKTPVSALAFSPDGKRLATAGEDRRIVLWDAASGKQLGKLEGHTDRIPALAWHPDGVHLVSAGWDTTARVWDTRSLQPVILFNSHAGQVSALAFNRDGSLLACADSDDLVHVWDFAARKTLHVLRESETEIRHLAFSPDGQRMACGGGNHVIHLWDPVRGQPLTASVAPALSRISVDLSPDGRHLVTNGGGAEAKVWDAAGGEHVRPLDESAGLHTVAWSPDGKWIAGGSDHLVRLWEAATARPIGAFEGPDEPVTALAFAPDSGSLASASSLGLSVWLWRAADGEPILLIPDPLDGCVVMSMAWHPQGRLLAVGGIDWLATGGSTGAICLWDVAERAEVATFFGGTTCVAFGPCGDRLASTTLDQTVCIWDVASQQLVTELTGHEDTVNCVAFSPDGKLLASGSDDMSVRLWDAVSGESRAALPLDTQVKMLRFSPDGRYLFTGNGNTTCYRLEVARLL